MITASPVLTEYQVTFLWVASDWNRDVDQPTAQTEVLVTLPIGATPWDIYCKAESHKDAFPSLLDNAYGWDGDGMIVYVDSNDYIFKPESLTPDSKWVLPTVS